MNRRINKLNTEKNVGYLITNESNVTYLSGFTGEASVLIISLEGNVLMTDGRYDEQARRESGEFFEVTKWHNPKRPDPATIAHYVKKYGIQELIFNSRDLSVQHYNLIKDYFASENMRIQLKPQIGLVEKIREVKDENEIKYIRKACEIADQALEKTISTIKEGVTELEIVATLEYHMKMCGAENISFDTIVLSGTKTSLPHGKPSDKKLEKGDFLQLDFGALYKGYHSDMSRTFIIGEASEEQTKIYAMMLESTLRATDILQDGIDATVPDKEARSVLGDYEKYYYPGLGHGVGLDVHEEPYMSATSKHRIVEGQVVTIEPGIYIPDFGGMRIEDTILIKKDGYEVLSKFPRHLQILK